VAWIGYPTLLVDFSLPCQKGDWLFYEALRLMPAIRLVLFSATAVLRLPDLRAKGGVALFLLKPFDLEEYGAYLSSWERR
jgi:response regulator of citrate/malate metabolism